MSRSNAAGVTAWGIWLAAAGAGAALVGTFARAVDA
jgi:hypothetical protein